MRDSRRTRAVLVVLLLTAFTLITLDYRSHGGGVFGSVRRTATSIFGPIERLAADIVRPVRRAVQDVGSVGSNHAKLTAAQREVSSLQQQLRAEPFDNERATELNQLLHVSAVGQYKMVFAQVIAVSATDGFEWTATIDAGTRDGLKENMTVLNGDGLVGRLKTVGSSTSTVLLAIDPQFNVGVRLPNNEMGVVSGHGRGAMTLELLDPAARATVSQGLVTQGSLNQVPFIWGVPVGTVTAVSTPLAGDVQTGTVKPFVDFTALDIVGVVVEPPRTDPRGALLAPPLPTVTATATVTATTTATITFTPAPSFSLQPTGTTSPKGSPKPSVTPTPHPNPTVSTSSSSTAPPTASTSGASGG